MKKRWLYLLIGAVAVVCLMALTVHFNITGQYEGIFLLKGKKGALFEVKDDLYLGDGRRLIYGIDLDDPRYRLFRLFNKEEAAGAYLYYEWDQEEGRGFVRNFMPDGKQLLTCFGRYEEGNTDEVHGLFVGGGLPAGVRDDDLVKLDETGMAYSDGKRWYHIWCSVNEGISSAVTFQKNNPSEWKYLGSKVLNAGRRELAIRSSHQVLIDGTPLRIDRYAHFRAGDTYFILSVRITNVGRNVASYYYCYGDDPWVGDFGTSAGNVGWVKDGIINFEQPVDSYKYDFAGMCDYGNSVLGKGHYYTMTANFIEWLGGNRPELVYFSNAPGVFHFDEKTKIPLSSGERFIGLQWGPHGLKPGESESYNLAIGMAGHDPETGMPVKPEIILNNIP